MSRLQNVALDLSSSRPNLRFLALTARPLNLPIFNGVSLLSDLLNLDPWHDPVHGPTLLDELCGGVSHHVVFDRHIPECIALYVVQTWAMDFATHAPRLLLRSPTPRCGKSTVINMMGVLCRRPHIISEVTRASLLRKLDEGCSVLIDEAEADQSVASNKALNAVLHSGHDRGTAWISQMDRGENRLFNTFGPLVCGSIGSLNPTLMDRCVIADMKRSAEKRAKFRIDRADRFVVLARQCARWVADNAKLLEIYDPPMPDLSNDRAEDNWRLLVSIADIAGGDWPQRARDAAVALTKGSETTEVSEAEMLLQDIFAVWGDLGERAKSSALVSRLRMLEGRPWDGLTATRMATILKAFSDGRGSVIKPKELRFGQGVLSTNTRGYTRSMFSDAWARYCAPVAPVADVAGEEAEGVRWNLDEITRAVDSVRLAISEAETAKAEVCPSNPDPEVQMAEEPARPDVIDLSHPSAPGDPTPKPDATTEPDVDPDMDPKRAERLAATAEVREIIKAFYNKYPRVSVERDKADVIELQGRIGSADLQISDANLMIQIRDLFPLKRGPRPRPATADTAATTETTPEAAE